MRQTARVAGTFLLGAGVLMLIWAVIVWRWQDPLTALYATAQQHRLAASFDQRFATYRPIVRPKPTKPGTHPRTPVRARPVTTLASLRRERALVRTEARRYRKSLHVGDALGRIVVPRLGLKSIVVTGTDHDSLTKGPGWYTGTFLPGEGQLVYIAGHRTTYLAPFAHIEQLRPGDTVPLELPYATIVYRVVSHVIVPANDVARLKSHGIEEVALQACHPRFFATHRYIVYARPTQLIPRGGSPIFLDARGRVKLA